MNISDNNCEICTDKNKLDKDFPIEVARVAMNDKDMRLHFSCFNPSHLTELWDKIGKP